MRPSPPPPLVTALTLLLLAPAALGAQEDDPQAAFEEEVEVTEVLLDALVTNEAGEVVLGLDPAAFVVTEDGEPVELTGATFYSNRRFEESEALAERLGVDLNLEPADRYFILFFQDDRTLAGALAAEYLDAARFTRRWVLEELLPNDQVAVVSYGSSLKIWQDFTTDKREVEAAVDAIFTRKGSPIEVWPSRAKGSAGPSLLDDLPQGKELQKQSRKIYDGLRLVAEATEGIQGRKNLIFYSLGFGEVRELGVWTPDPRYWDPMVQQLNDHNVAVYAIDLISTVDQGSIQDRGNNQALSQLAADTGGRYHFRFTTFGEPLEEVAEENNGYYLLSYRATHPKGEKGYQRVEVKMRNPDFQVKAREGYLYGE